MVHGIVLDGFCTHLHSMPMACTDERMEPRSEANTAGHDKSEGYAACQVCGSGLSRTGKSEDSDELMLRRQR
jgi:hypothetical protein